MSLDKNNQKYKKTSFLTGFNSSYIEEYYSTYIQNKNLLSKDWIDFFDGLDDESGRIIKNLSGPSWKPKKIKKLNSPVKTAATSLPVIESHSSKQASQDSVRAIMLVRAFRIRGHLIANLDPLELQKKEEHLELKPETYGFTKKDYNRKIFLDGVLGIQYGNLNEILKILKKTYCSTIGYEFMHMSDPDEKAWIRNRIEGPEKDISFTDNGKKAILNKIIQAEGFEKYLQVKFVGTKRIGLDGCEALIPALEQIIKRGGNLGVKEIKIVCTTQRR